jgi:hypothetical protein
VLSPFGANPARCDAVDAYFGSKGLGQASRGGHHCALGGGEVLAAVAGHTGLCLIPAHVDDRSPATLPHEVPHRARESERGDYINAPCGIQLFFEWPVSGLTGKDVCACVVDPAVDGAPIPRFSCQAILRFGVAEIG